MPPASKTRASRRYDVIVAGLGSMGAAACWHLARRGLSVAGFERHSLVHEYGAHHGRARMIRQAYFEHPDYVPLIRRAYENWDELGEITGSRSLHRTGGLYMGRADGTIVSGSVAAAEQHRLEHELLDHQALANRFADFHLPADMVGFFEPDAGYLIPETAVASHLSAARAHGAELHDNQAVRNWQVETRGEGSATVVVETDRHRYQANHLILSAGAWTSGLLAGLNLELQVTRQVQAWFRAENPRRFDARTTNFPCWFIETDPPCGHYGFPIDADGTGLKVARHQPGSPTDPDRVDRQVAKAETDALAAILQRYLPGAAGPVVDSSVCLYTNSADGHFIVDCHPQHPQVSLACGFSGHGFKFASVIGEVLADFASRGATDLPIGFLGLSRFR